MGRGEAFGEQSIVITRDFLSECFAFTRNVTFVNSDFLSSFLENYLIAGEAYSGIA
jgi:hypothetical protein